MTELKKFNFPFETDQFIKNQPIPFLFILLCPLFLYSHCLLPKSMNSLCYLKLWCENTWSCWSDGTT